MFSNQKRHTSDSEDILLPAVSSSKDNSSAADVTDAGITKPPAMVGGFSLQTRSSQSSTGLGFTPPSQNRNYYSKSNNEILTFCCSNFYRRYDDGI